MPVFVPPVPDFVVVVLVVVVFVVVGFAVTFVVVAAGAAAFTTTLVATFGVTLATFGLGTDVAERLFGAAIGVTRLAVSTTGCADGVRQLAVTDRGRRGVDQDRRERPSATDGPTGDAGQGAGHRAGRRGGAGDAAWQPGRHQVRLRGGGLGSAVAGAGQRAGRSGRNAARKRGDGADRGDALDQRRAALVELGTACHLCADEAVPAWAGVVAAALGRSVLTDRL